jgi:hypothetical protein
LCSSSQVDNNFNNLSNIIHRTIYNIDWLVHNQLIFMLICMKPSVPI